MSAPAPSTRRSPSRHARHRPPGLLFTAAALLRVLVIGLFLLTFIVQPYRIPSPSMVPTLEVGDCVLVTKTTAGQLPLEESAGTVHTIEFSEWVQRLLRRLFLPPVDIRRGDLAVFHFPPDPSRDLVKRIVGMPGDRIRLRDGRVLLNDIPLLEPYTLYTGARPDLFRDEFPNLREADPNVDPHWWLALRRTLREDGNLVVPANAYFVLGDNRNNSEDSRYWGFVPRAAIEGQPMLVYFSVPNGADAPDGGVPERLRWLIAWNRKRIGILH